MTIDVGLVGFGLSGRILHLPLIRAAQMRVSAVVTSQVQAVRAVLPQASVYGSTEEMLQREHVPLVVITSPNHLHVQQAELALKASRHVVIDKPFTLNVSGADALIACAQRQSRLLCVFHNRRWDSDFLTLRNLIERGQLGEIRYAQLRWDRFRPQIQPRWREQSRFGGGVLLDLGSHLIDQALVLFGDPEWLQADVFTQRPGATVEDGFEILLGKGALRISLGASSISTADGTRYRVYGTRASWIKRGLDSQESQLRAGLAPLDGDFGVEAKDTWGMTKTNEDDLSTLTPASTGCWLQFYRELALSIETGSPVPVAAHEARRVMQIIEAAIQSSRDGRRVSW